MLKLGMLLDAWLSMLDEYSWSQLIDHKMSGNESPDNKILFVDIEGGVGAGKSTLLEELDKLGFAVKPEPIAKWQPMLKLAKDYESQFDFSYGTQSQFLRDVVKARSEALQIPRPKGNLVFFERSLQSVAMFSKMKMDGTDLQLFNSQYEAGIGMVEGMGINTVRVVLDVPVMMCLERARRRGREGDVNDANVALELQELHEKHFPRDAADTLYVPVDNGELGIRKAVRAIIEFVNKQRR